MSTLKSRIAIVTGASAGIGLEVARDLVAQGARVVLNARRKERLDEVAAGLPHGSAAVEAGDASDLSVIRRVLDRARGAFKAEADLIVINAGRGLNGSVMTSDTSQWEEMVRTNYLGCAYLLREAGHRMLAAVGGVTGPACVASPRDIIVLGSTVGRHVSPFSSMYGSTKFAVHGLVEGARRELGPKGIRVSLIEPGFVESEFQGVAGYDRAWFEGVKERIGPVLQPPDVARTVTFIAQQPPGVHVSDMLIRPTRQDYP
ncbi:MAG: SDR family oxidoreductase [Phycisphaerales bacterium]